MSGGRPWILFASCMACGSTDLSDHCDEDGDCDADAGMSCVFTPDAKEGEQGTCTPALCESDADCKRSEKCSRLYVADDEDGWCVPDP